VNVRLKSNNSKGKHYSYGMHLPQRWFVVATAFLFLVAANLLPVGSAKEATLDLSLSDHHPLSAPANVKSGAAFDPLAVFSDSQVLAEEPCMTPGVTRVELRSATQQTCIEFKNLGFKEVPELYWGYPIKKDAQLHTSVNNLLAQYFRNFASPAEQDLYEERITSNLEYSAFVGALVRMDNRDFPGFADQVTNTNSLKAAITPWAEQIARHYNLPTEFFATIGDGILITLAKSGDVTQERFDSLMAKCDVIAAYAMKTDTAYQLTSIFPSDAKTAERFLFIDSLVGKTEVAAKQAYLDMAVRNAIRIHPDMQADLESGLSVVQILRARNAKSAAAFLKTVKPKAPVIPRKK